MSDIPSEVFRKLPAWCVYIELYQPPFFGVFVHLNQEGRMEQIRFLFHRAGEVELSPKDIAVISLNEPTIEKGFDANTARIKKIYEEANFDSKTTMSQEAFDATPHAASLALYLCSQDADYQQTELRIGKQTIQPIARRDPLIIEVGARIGETLRKARAESSGQIGGGISPRCCRVISLVCRFVFVSY